MVPKLGDKQSIVRDFVDHTVLFVDPLGPIASQTMFKRLRFANAFKRLAFGVFNQLVDSVENFFVGFLPVQIVFPDLLPGFPLLCSSKPARKQDRWQQTLDRPPEKLAIHGSPDGLEALAHSLLRSNGHRLTVDGQGKPYPLLHMAL